MRNRILNICTSLRLTVVCLAFSIILVFIGTLAQTDEGLYDAQERYFKSWLVMDFSAFGKRIPLPLPGGYTLGTLLVLNLTASHLRRFQLTWNKFGIHLTHGGLILLLVGQLATDLLSRESQMRFLEGETKSYSVDPMEYELALVEEGDGDMEKVIAISQSRLIPGATLTHPELPFSVTVESFWVNSEPSFRAPMGANTAPVTTNGLANSFDFQELAYTRKMDAKNVPTATLKFQAGEKSLGRWVVSGWEGDSAMVSAVRNFWIRQLGVQTAERMTGLLTAPQEVEVDGRRFRMSLRPIRYYKPYAMTLLERKHEVYPGTTIPKNFQSRILIQNSDTQEKREVDIYMNNPLRYAGLTFYQYQMSPEEMSQFERSSTLQVVRNPSWLTPYVGCLLVGAGLTFQFMMHLFKFIKRRSA